MRLLLADDHALFRDALVHFIERTDPDAHITVGKSLMDVLQIMEGGADIDLILLDLRMPGMDGLNGFHRVRAEYPDQKVAILSGLAEPADVNEVMEHGAVAYFPKTLSGKALLAGIRSVLEGQRYLPVEADSNKIMPSYYTDGSIASKIRNGVASHFMNPNVSPGDLAKSAQNLSPRERDVLKMLTSGLSNKEIGNNLGLQVVTVKLHVRSICRKLEVNNRTQAALKGQKMYTEGHL